MGAKWSDTDDAVVLAFPPAEAAAILGRTLCAVYVRRCLKGVSYAQSNRKPRTRLRREYYSTGDGPREEVVPAPVRKCRYCTRKHFAKGVCKRCYRWVQRMVESGYVSWEVAERCWLSGRGS